LINYLECRQKKYDPILIGVTSGKFSKTGKTSFINRFCRNEFSNQDHGQLSACTVKLDDDKTCLISFIESDSEERLKTCDAYYVTDKCWEKNIGT
jgi:GTPase SAR1 family protein